MVNNKHTDLVLFFKKTLLFLPLLIAIPIINFYSFPVGKEIKCAQQLLNGNCLYGKDSPFFKPLFNQRLLQRILIENFAKTKRVIVFGSSRSGQISLAPYLSHYSSFFNHSVDGAMLRDFIGLYGIYKKRNNGLPLTIILECSAWTLNKNYQQYTDSWAIKDGYDFIKNNSSIMNYFYWPIIIQLCDLYSPKLFQMSLSTIIQKKHNLSKHFYDILSDGQRQYTKIDKNKVLRSILSATSISELEKFNELDHDLMVEFENFIKTLLLDKIRVVFFLPPYHPLAYKKLASGDLYLNKMTLKAQDFFMQCAKKYSIEIAGSYDPFECGCNESDFYDCQHLYNTSTTKIFKSLLNSF